MITYLIVPRDPAAPVYRPTVDAYLDSVTPSRPNRREYADELVDGFMFWLNSDPPNITLPDGTVACISTYCQGVGDGYQEYEWAATIESVLKDYPDLLQHLNCRVYGSSGRWDVAAKNYE